MAGKQTDSHCPRCGGSVYCQGKLPGEECWCMTLPSIDPALTRAYPSCLCRHCLQVLLQQASEKPSGE